MLINIVNANNWNLIESIMLKAKNRIEKFSILLFCVCVCVCVWERERERERDSICLNCVFHRVGGLD